MLRRTLVLASAIALIAGSASAATMTYKADLTADSEVPPTKSAGSGEATVMLNTATHEATWDVTFSGFSSKAVAAHIHGPAPVGKNAGVAVPLGNNPTSPIKGSGKLTATQQQQLEDGMMYINVHTVDNKSGAIRGQLMPAK